jgi:hypothetical protein
MVCLSFLHFLSFVFKDFCFLAREPRYMGKFAKDIGTVRGIAVNSFGEIYVAFAEEICVYSTDFEFVFAFACRHNPHIAIDNDNKVWLCYWFGWLVEKFTRRGKLECQIRLPQTYGNTIDIAVDRRRRGAVFVLCSTDICEFDSNGALTRKFAHGTHWLNSLLVAEKGTVFVMEKERSVACENGQVLFVTSKLRSARCVRKV